MSPSSTLRAYPCVVNAKAPPQARPQTLFTVWNRPSSAVEMQSQRLGLRDRLRSTEIVSFSLLRERARGSS